MATKDPITCHVLDTTTGRPAAHMIATLICKSSPNVAFTAVTNADGRIAKWDTEVDSTESIESLIHKHTEVDGQGACPQGSSIWQLRFNTGAYYGNDKTFWPVVELTFFVTAGEHFHVPLLLGPYNYTTYRGS